MESRQVHIAVEGTLSLQESTTNHRTAARAINATHATYATHTADATAETQVVVTSVAFVA